MNNWTGDGEGDEEKKIKRRWTHSSSSRASCAAEMRACGFLSLHAFCITATNQTRTEKHIREVSGVVCVWGGSTRHPQRDACGVHAFAYWRQRAGGGLSRRWRKSGGLAPTGSCHSKWAALGPLPTCTWTPAQTHIHNVRATESDSSV